MIKFPSTTTSFFFISFLLVLTGAWQNALAEHPLQRLSVHSDGRYLIDEEGTPFFYLGDTAWELFHRLDRSEAELYLRDRAGKGFTVIQAVALAELDGLHTPNAYGHTPLIEDDPARPKVGPGENDDYWDHIDWVIRRAASMGLRTALLPTWGNRWNSLKGEEFRESFNPDNAKTYGRWIAERYKDDPIIWVLGGDRPIQSDTHRAIIRSMAEGIRQVVGDKQLITFHPVGFHSSIEWFADSSWIDFHMCQSGHFKRHEANYRFIAAGYELDPPKPMLDGEPRYEDIAVAFKRDRGRHGPWEVRQAGYWAVLSGACGHTYGNSNIWQMWQPGREPILQANTSWKDALHHPGALQMGILRRFFERHAFWQLEPDQQLIVSENVSGAQSYVTAARSSDHRRAILYLPTGKPVEVATDRLASGQLTYKWFSPRNSTYSGTGTFGTGSGKAIFAPSSQGPGKDVLLLLQIEEE